MISLDDARQFVLERCSPLPARDMAASELIGRVLATQIVATESVPPFRNSAVDGYAVRAADLSAEPEPIEPSTPPKTFAPRTFAPRTLEVVDEVAAGQASARSLNAGEAIRIMTGAPVPAGADAVAMVETTTTTPDRRRVTIAQPVEVGAGIRDAGSDIAIGDLLFEPGTEVTPAVAGVLASINVQHVLAVPRPRVAVLSTGDELVTDGSALGPGQIRESNLTMLAGLLDRAGCAVVNVGVVPDDEARLERVLRDAVADCDAVVSSGGVSMGDYDVVKAVLGRIADMAWMQVAIKPAKPFAFGLLDGVPIFGLPGNPVSSLVSFEMFARPALRKMAGHAVWARQEIIALVDEPLQRRPDGRVHLDRVIARFAADGRLHVTPARAQGSHQLAATALANGLAIVPDAGGVPAGAEVAVLLLD